MTTIATPLLAVKPILDLSLFNSLIACVSALLRSDLGEASQDPIYIGPKFLQILLT